MCAYCLGTQSVARNTQTRGVVGVLWIAFIKAAANKKPKSSVFKELNGADGHLGW